MNVRGKVLGGVLVAAFLASTGAAHAQSNNRIPGGHSYSPTEQRLPQLNSRRDKINSRADIYQAEIDRTNRETAITFGNMRIFGRDRLLRGGASNRPRF